AQESNTYNDFSKINIGGVWKDGSNNVNEVSYLLLETLEDMRTLQPNTAVLVSKKVPDRFLNKALEVVKPGFGEPPFFNHDEIIKILLRQGKSLEDARAGGVSGCVESGAFGKESYILTGYFNLPKVLEITLNNGVDPNIGKKIGVETGEPKNFDNFEDLFSAFKEQLEYFIDVKEKGNDKIESIYHEELPVPFLSLWIEDCVEESEDYNRGGARYNTQYIQIVGLGTITDSLASLKYHVFDENRYDLEEVLSAITSDFQDREKMRQIFLNKTPRYGNDDDYADKIASKVFNGCIEIVEGYPPTPIRNASRRVYGLPTTVHVYFGSECGATPDGRKAGKPLSEGISPVQGADSRGIGAVFRSVGKLDHVSSGGTLLNQKLSPDLVQDQDTRKKLGKLMRSYFKMDSHHVQYNVVSADLLREAQENPENFSDLMVRVAGYSDYFVNLPEGLQDEIIERTEQNRF
ncbi:MAG: pyruvate formate lyase family protein, partial [Candidatus Thermoplasmatota archaeon]